MFEVQPAQKTANACAESKAEHTQVKQVIAARGWGPGHPTQDKADRAKQAACSDSDDSTKKASHQCRVKAS